MTRLAYGVRAGRDLRVYAPGPDGAALDAPTGPPGAPVVVGPRRAGPDAVAAAMRELAELVERGGDIVAGADIDLGAGFRTGRLEGAAGDRRDAVLAALRVLGMEGAPRLGDRAAVLVALFGPAATRRVGAAATAAVQDGRWGALHLACAASDLLGPEQLERILALPEPIAAAEPGLASTLAADLARLLAPYPRPRRLTLLLDLWSVVAAQRAEADVRRRLRELRGSEEQTAQLRVRYQRLLDEETVALFGPVGETVGAFHLARWTPTPWHWRRWLLRSMADAIAATVLARSAVAVVESGVDAGLARMATQLTAPPARLSRRERGEAVRLVKGLSAVPARPGVQVGDLAQLLRQGPPIDAQAVWERLRWARHYAVVVLDAVRGLLESACYHSAADLSRLWGRHELRDWRALVGYSPLRPPHEWEQGVLCGLGEEEHCLAWRLREHAGVEPSDVEHPGDLLWLAELGDAVAQLDGFDAAVVDVGHRFPHIFVRPPAPERDPLLPAGDSVQAAVAGAAQLSDFGAAPPVKPRSWTELVDGLMASTAVAEALTGVFRVPRAVLAHDGAPLPGPDGEERADVFIEIARDPHQLVAWARYMGNCISGPEYLSDALRGRSVLLALRRSPHQIVANVELCPRRTEWRIGEFRARFNANPPAALEQRLRAWVAALGVPQRRRPGPAPKPRRGHHGDHRPYRPDRDLTALRRSLVPLCARAMDALAPAIEVLAPFVALRRAGRDELDEAVRSALAGGLDLRLLWRAAAARPLAEALRDLDPELRHRTPQLELLLGDAPLPALARRLGRTAAIAQARGVEVVGRRVRRSLGRLARGDDPTLAPLVAGRADPGLLCALVLAVSTGPGGIAVTTVTRAGQRSVPGHPASTVDDEDGPWRRAWAEAAELGAQLPDSPAELGLVVPTSWLGRGGWPALWARVHRAVR